MLFGVKVAKIAFENSAEPTRVVFYVASRSILKLSAVVMKIVVAAGVTCRVIAGKYQFLLPFFTVTVVEPSRVLSLEISWT